MMCAMIRGTMPLLVPFAAAGLCSTAAAQAPSTPYRLLPGSTVTFETCLGPCLCAPPPPVVSPLTGTFELTPSTTPDPIYAVYDVTRMSLRAATPGGIEKYEGQGTYRIGGDPAFMNRLQLQLEVGSTGRLLEFDSGFVQPHGAFPTIDINVTSGIVVCDRWTIHLVASPVVVCPADCSGDGRLDVLDFACFQNKFALGDPAADCTGEGVLDVRDFACFQNQFALGCP